jgi:hypothetical protein
LEIQTLNDLKEIGRQLNLNQFPRVYNGGLVLPDEPSILPSHSGMERIDVTPRKEPTTKRNRKRQAYRSRSTNSTASVVCSDLRTYYEKNISALLEIYPNTQYWFINGGMWLIVECKVLRDLNHNATFLIFVPFFPPAILKAWGFWTNFVSSSFIGPRHTNFPDGSVCAFEPKDRTWQIGDSLITLLDIYCVWAVRQLYLKTFKKWPGSQSVQFAYERLSELQDEELCGCENAQKQYIDCCKPKDLALDRNKLATDFLLRVPNFGVRTPPQQVLDFLKQRTIPPKL